MSSAAENVQSRREPVLTGSNHYYRIPEPWDLKPGLELLMVRPGYGLYDPARVGDRIQIDDVHESEAGEITVSIHFISPSWTGQFSIPAKDIVRLPSEQPHDSDLDLFWLPQDYAPQD